MKDFLYKDYITSKIDHERTVSRYAVKSCTQNDDTPILFRHYVHHHIGANTYNHQSLYTNTGWCTIFIAVDVSYSFLTESNMYSPHCGDIFIVRENEPYNAYYYASQVLNYYNIDIPNVFFEKNPGMIAFNDIFYGPNSRGSQMLTLSHDEQTKLFTLLCDIEEEISNNTPYSDNMIFAHLIRIANLICTNMGKENQADFSSIAPHLKSAVDYISENYLTIQSVDEIAEYCHISSSYLNRIFKKHLQTSPVEYINNLKITYAKYLLKTGHNVTETCFTSGFNSYNYFIAAFKKYVGMTPKEYAKGD